MNLLAFDTSTEYLSLALMQGDKVSTFDVLAGQSHSQLILPQIQTLLSEAGLQAPVLLPEYVSQPAWRKAWAWVLIYL